MHRQQSLPDTIRFVSLQRLRCVRARLSISQTPGASTCYSLHGTGSQQGAGSGARERHMATFTWTAGTSDAWSTLTDWSPLPASAPGSVAANRDVVSFVESTTGSKAVYTV